MNAQLGQARGHLALMVGQQKRQACTHSRKKSLPRRAICADRAEKFCALSTAEHVCDFLALLRILWKSLDAKLLQMDERHKQPTEMKLRSQWTRNSCGASGTNSIPSHARIASRLPDGVLRMVFFFGGTPASVVLSFFMPHVAGVACSFSPLPIAGAWARGVKLSRDGTWQMHSPERLEAARPEPTVVLRLWALLVRGALHAEGARRP